MNCPYLTPPDLSGIIGWPMNKRKVLATARSVALAIDDYRPQLEAAGLEVVFPENVGVTLTEEELLRLLPGCIAVVAMPDAYTARVIEAAARADPPLRLIARSGVGYDTIDLDAAARHGVWITITVGANHDAVADYTLGLLLALARRIVQIAAETRAGAWQRVSGMELRGKTLGVVGTGRIGREVAARARPFGLRVVAHDVVEDGAWAAAAGVTYLPPEQLLAEADIVSLHTPLTPLTRRLLNRETLSRCRRGVLIVNTARGELIDEVALLEALESGQVGGAALDVFAQEPPPPDHPLLRHPRVIPASHCAGAAREAQERQGRMALDEVLRVAGGERPRFPVSEY